MRIAIAGRIGAGKTSIAQRLGFQRMGFARALKQELSELLGIPVAEFESTVSKSKWRVLMQAWGEARRRVDPYYWVNKLLDELDDGDIVVDDVRFVNEMEALHRAGFQLVYLDCPKWDSISYMIEKGMTPKAAEAAAEAVSESEIPGILCEELPPHVDVRASRQRRLDDIYEDVMRAVGR